MDGAHLCFPLKRKEEHPHHGKCEGQWGEKRSHFYECALKDVLADDTNIMYNNMIIS